MADIAGWDARAGAWVSNEAGFERQVAPVTEAMLRLAALGQGEKVLELACGPGGMIPRLLAAVSPGGQVVASDISPEMVAAAKANHGTDGVEVIPMGIDWIDGPSGVADAVFCRFGYMFADDPAAALHEARRVLRGGGRLIAAVWTAPSENPYGSIPLQALARSGVGRPPEPGDAGMFRLAEPGCLKEMCLDAAFVEVTERPVDFRFRFDSFQALLDWTCSISQTVASALAKGGFELQDAWDGAMRDLTAPYVSSDGKVALPARVLVLKAEA